MRHWYNMLSWKEVYNSFKTMLRKMLLFKANAFHNVH